MKKLVILAAAAFALSACGKGDKIVFDTALGPRTATQVKELPNSLKGDTDNARYSNEQLKGQGMESTDGKN